MIIIFIIFFIVNIIVIPLLVINIHMSFMTHTMSIGQYGLNDVLSSLDNQQFIRLLLSLEATFMLFLFFIYVKSKYVYHARTDEMIKGVRTPKVAGQNQFGSARFMTNDEFMKEYDHFIISKKNIPRLDKGGVVVSLSKKRYFHQKEDMVFYISSNTHTLLVGATNSGKSRTVILQTIATLALSQENMIVNDPKGELYDYTGDYLKSCGYTVLLLDFKNPLKSNKYNFLEPVIQAVNEGDIPKAIDKTWDIVTSLADKSEKGERIWKDGEMSVIASSILAVVYDNKDRPQYQNMSNVYYFVATMCKANDKGHMLLTDYVELMKLIDKKHPAVQLMAISEVAPFRTRGSFYTSALATLRLFTNPYIYSMSYKSEIKASVLNDQKTAVFIILPDHKTTYYPIATLFITQLYQELIDIADARGGQLSRRLYMILDEFGNFSKIEDLSPKMTASRSRGILFLLALQDFRQMEVTYSKELAHIIRGNCENWIFLQSDDPETLEEISKKMDEYTTSSYSINNKSATKTDHNINLMGRRLLKPNDIGRIRRPQTLVIKKNMPVIVYAPDLSKWYFNEIFGLADEAHNLALRERKTKERDVLEAHNRQLLDDLPYTPICENIKYIDMQKVRELVIHQKNDLSLEDYNRAIKIISTQLFS